MDSVLVHLDSVSRSSLVGLIGFILTIVSLILAFVFYEKSKRIRQPIYAIRSFNLVRDFTSKLESLQMIYTGQTVRNLTVTRLAIWNNGKGTINSSDITTVNPLAIKIVDQYKILDATVLLTKNAANCVAVHVSPDQSLVSLNFDYLDYLEGAIIQLIHTGDSSADLTLIGTIKGAGKLARKTIPRIGRLTAFLPHFLHRRASIRKVRMILGSISVLMGLAVLLLAIFFQSNPRAEAPPELLVYFLGFFGFLLYAAMGFRLMRRGMPKGFDLFEEGI